MIKIQTDPYTLIPGGPGPSTTQNIEDPNFGELDGHLDEINPSLSKNFNAMHYNIRFRQDVTIPAYQERDRFPETPLTCNRGDESDAIRIILPTGEYKFNSNQKVYTKVCNVHDH